MPESESTSETFIVVGAKTWNRRAFEEIISNYEGQWLYIDDRRQLTLSRLDQVKPRYIFFMHWSWVVPEQIVKEYECVCFHMTDVPYGRGGSPLQNLIVRGHRETKLTALRMVHELDSGPVYFKEPLSLEGNAEQIYIRASELSAKMIKTIIDMEPIPEPQSGQAVHFVRRRPSESEIPQLDDLQQLHDFLRMLDAEGYPKAFLKNKGYRYEFSRAVRYDNRVVADVSITPLSEEEE